MTKEISDAEKSILARGDRVMPDGSILMQRMNTGGYGVSEFDNTKCPDVAETTAAPPADVDTSKET